MTTETGQHKTYGVIKAVLRGKFSSKSLPLERKTSNKTIRCLGVILHLYQLEKENKATKKVIKMRTETN